MCRFAYYSCEPVPLLAVYLLRATAGNWLPKVMKFGGAEWEWLQSGMLDILSDQLMDGGYGYVQHLAFLCFLFSAWELGEEWPGFAVIFEGRWSEQEDILVPGGLWWMGKGTYSSVEAVKCTGGWERGAVTGTLWRTEIWSEPVIILGEQESWRNLSIQNSRALFHWCKE